MSKGVTHIVSYSGGIGSYGCAVRLLDRGLENIKLLFCDTKTEDADLYRFLNETSEQLGLELIKIEDGRNVWEVFNDVKYMGNSRVDPCSKHLKRELFRKWIKKHYKPDECIIYVGIDWTEIHRLERIVKSWEPYKIEAPLTEKPYVLKQDLSKRLGDIKQPRLYKYGFPHNNCGGFCIKSGQAQFALLLKHFPKRYAYHEQEQERLFEKIGQRGFIRMTRNGKMKYMSLREFREHIENKGDVDQLELGGCGCFV